MKLVWNAAEYLTSDVPALERGGSPDNIRGAEGTREQLEAIAADPNAFLSGLVVRKPDGKLVTLPDGSPVPQLPGRRAPSTFMEIS